MICPCEDIVRSRSYLAGEDFIVGIVSIFPVYADIFYDSKAETQEKLCPCNLRIPLIATASVTTVLSWLSQSSMSEELFVRRCQCSE